MKYFLIFVLVLFSCSDPREKLPYNLSAQVVCEYPAHFEIIDSQGFPVLGPGFRYTKSSSFIIATTIAYGYNKSGIIVQVTDKQKRVHYLKTEVKKINNDYNITFIEISNKAFNKEKININGRWLVYSYYGLFFLFLWALWYRRHPYWVYGATYDSWNRVRTMTYPDGEVVTYHYNAAGQVEGMSGSKQGKESVIVAQIGYDKDGHTVCQKLGNGTETTYAFDKQRERLQNATLTIEGQTVMDNNYKYDAVDSMSVTPMMPTAILRLWRTTVRIRHVRCTGTRKPLGKVLAFARDKTSRYTYNFCW